MRKSEALPSPVCETLNLSQSREATDRGKGPSSFLRVTTRGNYLLEFSAVLAVILPLVLGAIDINSALQGYTAVQESVATTSRCVYPTDSACTSSATFNQATRYFDWYRGTVQTEYSIPVANYSGTAHWLTGPRYTWETYSALAYQSVSYDVPMRNYQAFETGFSAAATLQMPVQKSGLPYVTGSNPYAPSGYKYRGNHSQNFAPVPGVTFVVSNGSTLNKVRRVVNNGVVSYTKAAVQFTVPDWVNSDWFQQLYCVKSTTFDTNSPTQIPNFAATCDRTIGGTSAIRIPIAFRLGGMARNGQSGQSNGVNVTLKYLANGAWQDFSDFNLGGRTFGSPGNGNSSDASLDPRGFGANGVTPEMLSNIQREGAEPPIWATASVLIPANATQVRLVVQRGTGFSTNVEWELQDFKIFLPQYSSESLQASCSSCSNNCMLSAMGRTFGAGGEIPTVTSMSQAQQNPGTAVLASNSSSTANQDPVSTIQRFPSAGEAQTALGGSLAGGCPVQVVDLGASYPDHFTLNCPLHPQLLNLPTKQSECVVNLSPYATNVTYQTVQRNVPQTPQERAAFNWSFTWQKNTCADEFTPSAFTPPAGLARYSSFQPPALNGSILPTMSLFDVTTLAGADPRMLPSGSPFACAAFITQSQLFEGDGPNPSPLPAAANSIFAGEHDQMINSPGCLQMALRNAALQLGMASYKYLEPHSVYLRRRSSPSSLNNSCISEQSGTSVVDASLIAESVPEGQAPSGCSDGGCYSIFASVDASSSGGVTHDLATAQDWGRQQLAAAFPRARFDCPEGSTIPDCAWVTAAQIGEEVEVSSRLNVPFYFLGNETHQISRSERRRLEKTFQG
jgi:hypothetical protein